MCLSLHLFSLFINNVDDQNRSTNCQRTHTQIHTGVRQSFISQLFEIIRPLCISVPVLKKTHTSLDVMKRSKTYFWPNSSLIKAERNCCAFQEIKKIDGTFMSGLYQATAASQLAQPPVKLPILVFTFMQSQTTVTTNYGYFPKPIYYCSALYDCTVAIPILVSVNK